MPSETPPTLQEITFILPTMNRKNYICRAIESCLACQSTHVKSHVLVIDGQSNDGSYELLIERYAKNERVKIIRHDRVGFQRTAYFGVLQVATAYATFMYDDDILSPYFYQLFEKMLSSKKEFGMGYGKVVPVDEAYPFKPITEFTLYPKYDLTLAYFGYANKVKYFNMPVSPICCIAPTAHWKNWVQFTQDYAKLFPIRWHFMVERNIGPDLILYLSSILKEQKTVLLSEHIVGQFSSHPTSMSIGYGNNHLEIGYWFGKMWAFEAICSQGDKIVAARCAAYLLIVGYKILMKLPFGKDRQWFWAFWRQIWEIKRIVIQKKLFIPLLGGLVVTIHNKIKSRHVLDLPS